MKKFSRFGQKDLANHLFIVRCQGKLGGRSYPQNTTAIDLYDRCLAAATNYLRRYCYCGNRKTTGTKMSFCKACDDYRFLSK